jgi:hypothetical protein
LQLQQHERTFEGFNTRIAVVTFEATPFGQAYAAETKLRWPILIDQGRTLYRHYGMHRGRISDIWGFPTWWAYAKEIARGRVPRPSAADTRQLGGDVLIDPSGIVRLHHVGRGPADRPPVAAILAVLQRHA